jgi:hypothetical protein
MSQYDAILVPGGGVTEAGAPHPWVMERLRHAASVQQNAWIVCLSGYTPHKPPPLSPEGFPISESAASMAALLHMNVPADRILSESSSFDTIGNAYFSRTIHADVLGWSRLLVVTSKFHMPRTRAIFETIYALPAQEGTASPCRLEFAETADVGIAADDLAARVTKETRDLERWKANCNRLAFTSLQDVHRWLFSEHDCYAAGRQPGRHVGHALSTY